MRPNILFPLSSRISHSWTMWPLKMDYTAWGYFHYVFSLCLIVLFFLLQNILVSLKKSSDRDENKD